MATTDNSVQENISNKGSKIPNKNIANNNFRASNNKLRFREEESKIANKIESDLKEFKESESDSS
jgi:hypothetical protein